MVDQNCSTVVAVMLLQDGLGAAAVFAPAVATDQHAKRLPPRIVSRLRLFSSCIKTRAPDEGLRYAQEIPARTPRQ